MTRFPTCECCKLPILADADGFEVRGNIYSADGGGLIGDNFPKETEQFYQGEVKSQLFCLFCFFNITFKALHKDMYFVIDDLPEPARSRLKLSFSEYKKSGIERYENEQQHTSS